MNRTPAWYAGYDAGNNSLHTEICVPIEPPADYIGEQRSDFISGWLVGARDAADQSLIDELFR